MYKYLINAVSAALPAAVLFLAIALPGVKSSPYIISDDRVRSLDISPVLGRGYSIMTNIYQSTWTYNFENEIVSCKL